MGKRTMCESQGERMNQRLSMAFSYLQPSEQADIHRILAKEAVRQCRKNGFCTDEVTDMLETLQIVRGAEAPAK
jgi:hypothetical protein